MQRRFRDNAGAHSITENDMPTRTWCSALVACLLLAGCTAMQPRPERTSKKLDCDGSRDCTVVVTVTCSHWFGCELTVDHDLILVTKKGKNDLRWKLDGEKGAEFASNGIVIDNSRFGCAPEGHDKFTCTDDNQGFDIFKYAINVTIKQSAFGPRGVQTLDPWIVNR
jgi:hypothetical protein